MARHSEGAWYRKAKDTWYATVDGRKVSLGVKGKTNRKAAQEAWHRLMTDGPPTKQDPKPEASRETKPAAITTDSPSTTVKALLLAFLADAKGRVKSNTLATYAGLLNGVCEVHGERLAESFAPAALLAYANQPEWGSSHRHNIIGAVQTAYQWGMDCDLIRSNPISIVKRPPKASRGMKAVVAKDTHEKLLTASNHALRNLLTLLHATGARPSELSRLTAADVNLTGGVAILADHKTATSSGRPRVLYLIPAAVAILRELVEKFPTGPLLRNARGGVWTKDGIGLAMRRACEKAGVKAVAYGFRHTYATDALAGGVPDAVVAELLGHSSTAMLHKHYSHLASRGKQLTEAAGKVRG